MAFFPDYLSNVAFFKNQCDRCMNSDDLGSCVIADVHFVYNSAQLKPGNEPLRKVLRCLISDDFKCALFRAGIGPKAAS